MLGAATDVIVRTCGSTLFTCVVCGSSPDADAGFTIDIKNPRTIASARVAVPRVRAL